MPHTCRVTNCKVTYGTKETEDVSFHQLPKNNERCTEWTEILRNKCNVELRASDRLCSRHFDRDCFSVGSFGKRRLKPNAVPTIFNITLPVDETSEPIQEAMEVANLESSPIEKQHQSIEIPRVDCGQSTSNSELGKPSGAIINDSDENHWKASESDMHAQNRKRRYNKRYFTDWNLDELECTPKVRKVLELGREEVMSQRRKIRTLQMQKSGMMTKIKTLKGLLEHLTKRNSISKETSNLLEVSVPQFGKEMLQRLLHKSKKKFPPALRCFATTLQFYSSKAYNYVRTVFCKSLPHPNTIRKWYQKVDGSPGISKESIIALKNKATMAQENNHVVLCNMTMDEIMIKKKTECVAGKMWGYIDLGTGLDDDSLDEANSALVVMLVCINSNWKIPIAYFLISALKGHEKANLVNECLKVVHETGVVVTSLTFDGIGSNVAMCNILGAQTWVSKRNDFHFSHPVTGEPVFILLDPPHALKLVRGTVHDRDSFDEDNNCISWSYIGHSVDLQEREGLHAATRLRRRHLNWQREKMNVKLAAQTLSSSVGHALLFAEKDLKLPKFQGAEATARFCFMFDSVFDILNSRNKYCKTPSRAGMNPDNIISIRQEIQKIIQYIKTLRDSKGLIIESNRKTGFIGLMISLTNVIKLYDNYIMSSNNAAMKYLLTYKLSQDHLEVFFSAIRSRGGFNNNPTCLQFATAYKRLLVHAEVKGSERANATALDSTTILQVTSTASNVSKIDQLCYEEDILDTTENDDYFDPAWTTASTEYMKHVLEYIAGFVVRSVLKKLKCFICPFLLTSDNSSSKLLNRKTRGGLITASPDVIAICCLSENRFRTMYAPQKNIFNKLSTVIIQSVPRHLLETNHVYDQNPLSDHRFQLIKLIVQSYLRIRINHEEKGRQESIDRIRKVYSRMIVHKHQ